MVVEAVQTYVNLVNGLSKATREKARSAAYGLLAQAGLEDVANDAEKRVGKLTEEILGASRANRELLENLVAAEVTKAASRLGFVRSEELDEIREEIAEVRAQLAREKAGHPPAATATPPTRARTATKKTTPAAPAAPDLQTPAAGTTKAPAARKAAARKAPAKKTVAAGRASSTRPGAAQKRAATQADGGSAPAQPVPDPTADAGA